MPTADSTPLPPFEPASLFTRCAAFCYDLLLLVGLVASFTLLAVLLHGEAIAPGSLSFQAALLAIITVFFCGFWTRGGQTVGMKAWRIRVVARTAGRSRWPRAALRFFASWLSLLPAGLGYWWALVDRERCCWHDRLSGTRVIRASASARPLRSPSRRGPRS